MFSNIEGWSSTSNAKSFPGNRSNSERKIMAGREHFCSLTLCQHRECSISSERNDPTVLKERRKQKRGEMEKSRVYYRMSRIPPREGLIFQPVEGNILAEIKSCDPLPSRRGQQRRVDEGEIARNQIYSHSGAMLPVNADVCQPFPTLGQPDNSYEATPSFLRGATA